MAHVLDTSVALTPTPDDSASSAWFLSTTIAPASILHSCAGSG